MADATAAGNASGNASGDALKLPHFTFDDFFLPPFLPEGVVCDILLRLPGSEDAFRAAAVCRRWRPWLAVMSSRQFVASHLTPDAVPLHGPGAIIIQPRREGVDVGYVHIAVVHTTGGNQGITLAAAVAGGERCAVFINDTLPFLDLAVIASHGTLLLCRSRAKYFVCDAAANRWLQLPNSPLAPVRHTHAGFRYNVVEGKLVFTVVLLAELTEDNVAVDTFNSATATWQHREVHAPGAGGHLGGGSSPSPGVYTASGCYWLSASLGHVVFYDCSTGQVAVLTVPGVANEGDIRVRASRALGSEGGIIRFSAVDVAIQEGRVQARLKVWELQGGEPAEWGIVHNEAWRATWIDHSSLHSGFMIISFAKNLLRYDLLTGAITQIGRFGRVGEQSPVDLLYRSINSFPLHINLQ